MFPPRREKQYKLGVVHVSHIESISTVTRFTNVITPHFVKISQVLVVLEA